MSLASMRFGTAHLVLWCQAAIGGVMLLSGVLRMLPEQLAFAIGLVVAEGQNAPERVLLLLHLAGYAALVTALWMWGRGDGRTWFMMKVAAGWQFLLAPAGLPVAALLWWLSRHPEREDASQQMPVIAGNRRWVVLLTWFGANATVFLAGFGAFFLLAVPPLWFLVVLAASLPMFGALFLLMGSSRSNEAENIMPALPDLIQS